MDSTKGEDGVTPQTQSRGMFFHPSSDWKDWQKEEVFDSLFNILIRGGTGTVPPRSSGHFQATAGL